MRIVAAISVLVSLYACQGTPLKTDAGEIKKDSIAASKEYYPISSFIREELVYARENPTAITRYIRQGNRVDSSFVPIDTLETFATAFTGIDLNDASVKKHVEEKIFRDESIGMVTLSYTVGSGDAPLKRADVLVQEGEVKNKVSSIYLETIQVNEGTTILKKLFWKSRKNCMVIEQKTDPAGNEQIIQTQLVWNAGE